jgi:hypothetical protein
MYPFLEHTRHLIAPQPMDQNCYMYAPILPYVFETRADRAPSRGHGINIICTGWNERNYSLRIRRRVEDLVDEVVWIFTVVMEDVCFSLELVAEEMSLGY